MSIWSLLNRLWPGPALGLLLALSSLQGWADGGTFVDGVKAYREGRYQVAATIFEQLHAAQPEAVKITYYLAMTEAQRGRFKQARQLYEQVITLEPNGELAAYARQGIQFLPSEETALDPPPRFEMEPQEAAVPVVGQAAQPAAGMTPQEMMALQMMMSGGNGNNNAGFNPLAWMMMSQPQTNGVNPMGNIDPNVMSTMLMNQMMSNFDFTGGNEKDR